MTRAELDRQITAVLREMVLFSHVGSSSFEPRSRSRTSDGGDRPTGDLDHEQYATAYERARTDQGRERVIRDAQRELEEWRGRGRRDRPAGESEIDLVQRMLRETRGMSPEDAATTRFRMSARRVRTERRRDGRDPETGDPLPDTRVARTDSDADRARRRQHVRDLVERRGYSVRDAARLLNVAKSTVADDLKRAA